MHFFNHQTHHRGQASTLLSQQGIDIGVTDLLMLSSESAGADRRNNVTLFIFNNVTKPSTDAEKGR